MPSVNGLFSRMFREAIPSFAKVAANAKVEFADSPAFAAWRHPSPWNVCVHRVDRGHFRRRRRYSL